MPQALVAKTFGAIVVETKLIFFITKVHENLVIFKLKLKLEFRREN